MKVEATETLARQWAMLRAIPRFPQRVSTGELAATLLDQGFKTSRRTIERDLMELSGRFPLVVDDTSKPYGWSWMKDANFEFMPGLTPSQSVALLLAKTHLRALLPQSMHKDLMPVFETAERAIATTGWKDWHKRTAVVPATMALLPPKVDSKDLATVQTALARKRCLEGRYRTKGSREAKKIQLHPLGLLSRGAVLYLICTLFDYDDVRQLALHRLTDVSELAASRKEPRGFDFNRYVASAASSFYSRGSIRLVVWFDPAAAEHLRETPLSKDQTWDPVNREGKVEVSATVDDNEQLRWWLLAFGSQAEVKEPASLRAEISADHKASIALYGPRIKKAHV